jgi:hypothetical protein
MPDDEIMSIVKQSYPDPTAAAPEQANLPQPAAPVAAQPNVPIPPQAIPPTPVDPNTPRVVPPTISGKQGYNLIDAAATMVPFSDEIAGGLRAGRQKLGGAEEPFGDLYNREVEEYRGQRDEFNRENPVASIAAPVAAGLATAPLALPAMAGRSLLAAGGIAAGGGAVAGLGEGEGSLLDPEGLRNRLESSAVGAATGFGLGVTGQALGKGLKRGYRYLQTKWGNRPPGEVESLMRVQQALLEGGMTPEDAIDELNTLRINAPDAVLADVNDTLMRLTRAVRTKGGQGAREVTENITDRAEGQRERVRDLIRANVSPHDSNTTYTQIADQRRVVDDANFANVNGPVPLTSTLRDMLANRNIQQAMREGLDIEQNLANAAGRPFNPIDYGVTGTTADGLPIVEGAPNIKLWHAIKYGLDQKIDTFRDDVTGRLKSGREPASLSGLKTRLVGELKNQHPAYRHALEQSADPAESMEAINAGRDFMKGDWDKVIQRFESLRPEDQELYRIGVARRLQELADDTNKSGQDISGAFANDKLWRRLDGILPQQQAWTLKQSILNERGMQRTGNRITSGSQTADKLSDVSEPSFDPLDLVTSGGRANATRRLIDKMRARGPDRGVSKEAGNLLAPLLTRSDDAAMNNLISELNGLSNPSSIPEAASIGGLLGLERGRTNMYEASQERR